MLQFDEDCVGRRKNVERNCEFTCESVAIILGETNGLTGTAVNQFHCRWMKWNRRTHATDHSRRIVISINLDSDVNTGPDIGKLIRKGRTNPKPKSTVSHWAKYDAQTE
jgi:hypothetical protein